MGFLPAETPERERERGSETKGEIEIGSKCIVFVGTERYFSFTSTVI